MEDIDKDILKKEGEVKKLLKAKDLARGKYNQAVEELKQERRARQYLMQDATRWRTDRVAEMILEKKMTYGAAGKIVGLSATRVSQIFGKWCRRDENRAFTSECNGDLALMRERFKLDKQ